MANILKTVPTTRSSERQFLDDGSTKVRCWSISNPHYYIDENDTFQSIDDTFSEDVELDIDNCNLKKKNVHSVGLRKGKSPKKFMGLRPDHSQHKGNQQLEFSIDEIMIDGVTNKKVDLKKNDKIDNWTTDLGDVMIRSNRQGVRQLIKSGDGESDFAIKYTLHLKGFEIDNDTAQYSSSEVRKAVGVDYAHDGTLENKGAVDSFLASLESVAQTGSGDNYIKTAFIKHDTILISDNVHTNAIPSTWSRLDHEYSIPTRSDYFNDTFSIRIQESTLNNNGLRKLLIAFLEEITSENISLEGHDITIDGTSVVGHIMFIKDFFYVDLNLSYATAPDGLFIGERSLTSSINSPLTNGEILEQFEDFFLTPYTNQVTGINSVILDDLYYIPDASGRFNIKNSSGEIVYCIDKPKLLNENFEIISDDTFHTLRQVKNKEYEYIKYPNETCIASKGLADATYIDADIYYGQTQDGWVQGTWGTFSVARNGAGVSYSSTNTVYTSAIGRTYYNAIWMVFFRTFLYFDTSPITGSVSYCDLYVKGSTGILPGNVCVQEGTQADTLSAADFQSHTGLYFDNVSWSNSNWNTFFFNEDGTDAINTSGTTKLCLREYNYDYSNSAPPVVGGYFRNGVTFADSAGTTDDPYLSITEASPPPPFGSGSCDGHTNTCPSHDGYVPAITPSSWTDDPLLNTHDEKALHFNELRAMITNELDRRSYSSFSAIGGAIEEISEVTTIADVSGSLHETYFELYHPSEDYYVWINALDPTDIDMAYHTSDIEFRSGLELDSNTYKFGTSSIYFDGVGAHLWIDDDCIPPDDEHGPACFTIGLETNWSWDLWVKHEVAPSGGKEEWYMHQKNNTDNNLFLRNIEGSYLQFRFKDAGYNRVNLNNSSTYISDTNWHHIAVLNVGDDWGLYLDGIQIDYDEWNGGGVGNNQTGGDVYFGREKDGTHLFNGWMDALVWTYTNKFSASPNVGLTDTITIPTSAPDSTNAEFLMNFEGDGVDPAVPGKTGIEVGILHNSTADTIAKNMSNIINNISNFSAVKSLTKSTITNSATGSVTDVHDSTSAATGFTFDTPTQGADLGGDDVIHDWPIDPGDVYTYDNIQYIKVRQLREGINECKDDAWKLGSPEGTRVTVVADSTASLNDTYFELYHPTTNYYVWFNVGGLGTDPLVIGKTGIEIPISINEDTEDIVEAMVAVMDGTTFVVTKISTAKVEIVASLSDNVTDTHDSVAAPTGFSFESTDGGTGYESIVSDTTINLGELSQNETIEALRDKLNIYEAECACDCNYCTCDCNYCTCDCNYCTCDCNYACTCDCAYA